MARRRPHLPGSAVAAGIAVASLVGTEAPLVGLPACRRVLVVAPHPDDETLGAGGTIARLTARGVHVEVLVVTDGEATIGARTSEAEVAASRRREVAAACAVLGTAPPVSLGVPDGAVHEHEPTVTAACEASIRELDPDLVLVPWSHERHPDHRSTTAAVAACARLPEQLWQYEVHTPIPYPDRVVDITGAIERKRAALATHVTAAVAFDLDASLGLARWRSLATRAGTGAAEAFLTTDQVGMRRAVDDARRLWSGVDERRP